MSGHDGGEAQRFIGLVLLVIGALWMAASGLCGAAMILSSISTSHSASELGYWILLVVFLSGLFGAIGFSFYVVGRNLRGKKS